VSTADEGRDPTTWPELSAQLRESRERSETYLRKHHGRSASAAPGDLAWRLAPAAEAITWLAIGVGPGGVEPLFRLYEPLLARALEEFPADLTKGKLVDALSLIGFVHAGQACGAPMPDAAHELAQRLLPGLARQRTQLTEVEQQTAGFAALGTGALDFDALTPFLGGGSLAGTIAPGQTFALNAQGFARYLASGLRAGSPAEALRPAWIDFMRHFPLKLASKSLRWVDLLFASRAFYVRLERRPAMAAIPALRELAETL